MPIIEWFYTHYFRVQTEGWENMPPSGKMLLVGSHNGGMASPDTSMFLYDWCRHFGCSRPVYALMHPSAWKIPVLSQQAAQAGAVMAHPKMATEALKRDAAVLVYPGGAQDMFRPYTERDKIYFAGRKGFIKLALRENAPIVPLISYGAHDTIIVLGDLYEQVEYLHKMGFPWKLDADTGVFPIYLGLPWGIGIGPILNFPLPHPIHTRVCKPIIFDRYGREASRDRNYVDQCYQRVCCEMQQELDNLIERVNE
ncbi:MAG: lysophospholipid acyltransferase family protein [Chroococcales cyanobacterium]